MRIAHLNFSDHGGAAIATRRLHRALLQAGLDSHLLLAEKHHPTPHATVVEHRFTPQPLRERLRKRLLRCRYPPMARDNPAYRKAGAYTAVSDWRSHLRPPDFAPHLAGTDIIHLHWVARFIDCESTLPWLARQAPLVWRLADIWPLLGIWHYQPDDAERSPRLDSYENTARRLKKHALDQIPPHRLTLIGTSRWNCQQARNTPAFARFPVRQIPNCLDTAIFRPLPKEQTRGILGIPHDKKVIGFIADYAEDPRKGFKLLLQAVNAQNDPDLLILTVGASSAAGRGDSRFRHLGRLEDEHCLALFYAALDVFICPSLKESFGQTVFEAMACGTPVAGFDAGGIPDMVRPGQTGWLAPVGDVEALAARIREALESPQQRAQYGRNARAVCEKEYALEVQARAYRDLYAELVETARAEHRAS